MAGKELRAECFVPDRRKVCNDDFAKLKGNFGRKEYNFVLAASSLLDKQVDVLVYQTRRESARWQCNRLATKIAELRSKGSEPNLPGGLARFEKALAEANDCLQKEAYEDVLSICKIIDIELDAAAPKK